MVVETHVICHMACVWVMLLEDRHDASPFCKAPGLGIDNLVHLRDELRCVYIVGSHGRFTNNL